MCDPFLTPSEPWRASHTGEKSLSKQVIIIIAHYVFAISQNINIGLHTLPPHRCARICTNIRLLIMQQAVLHTHSLLRTNNAVPGRGPLLLHNVKDRLTNFIIDWVSFISIQLRNHNFARGLFINCFIAAMTCHLARLSSIMLMSAWEFLDWVAH